MRCWNSDSGSIILENLATGLSTQAILDQYPSLTALDIKAALQYAVNSSEKRMAKVPPILRTAGPF